MLGTLFKHEMRATAKTFMWFYIAFAVIALVNILINPFAIGSFSSQAARESAQIATQSPEFLPEAIKGVLMAIYGIAIGVIAILTIVIIILRFYRNLLGDEGYLMMTLPVTREQHIFAKLFTAVIWTICTIVLIFFSLILLFSRAGVLGQIVDGINEMIAMGVPLDRWIALAAVILLISCFTNVLMFYAAMGIGPNLLKNRVGGSVLAYVIIYVASQLIMTFVLFGTISAILGNPQMAPVAPGSHGFAMPQEMIGAVDTIFLVAIIDVAAIGIVCWFITRFMLKRKLNLA